VTTESVAEILFDVTGNSRVGYTASARGYGIHTQAESIETLECAARDAVATYFDSVDLHIVRFIGLNRPS